MRNRVPQRVAARLHYKLLCSIAICAMTANSLAPIAAAAAAAADTGANDGNTTTPIKHVIVIIGENRTFDHLFATYQPVNQGETVLNLLSEGIVKADGTPGPNYAKLATQNQAQNYTTYQINPTESGPYVTLPPPIASGGPPPFSSVQEAVTYENGLPLSYYKFLTTGAIPTAIVGKPDTRIYYNGNTVNNLAPGPYQLTNSNNPNGLTLTPDDYAESPVHRFYQMWQETDCSAAAGCLNDLFAWVEATVGAGSNGNPPPANFTYKEGATALGFYNIQQGDVPYFKMLADTYSMSDNYHQAVNGGTGANHIMLGTGDAIWFSDGHGNPLQPPHNMPIAAGSPNAGTVDEVENPNPLQIPPTNNWYTQDGYGGGSYGSASYGGGSYTECADPSQPGVAAILAYLQSVNVNSNCQAGHYYLLNNYNPGYFGDGTNAYAQIKNPLNTVFTIPPSSVPNIGDALLKQNITFAYFGDQFNAYLANPYNNYVTPDNQYCNICNFFQYSTSIMTNPPVRKMALQDTTDLYNDLMSCTATSCGLPAVSFVKPSGYLDGHPASSKINLLEGFVKKIVDLTKANSTLWANTAIFITMDEGGGYYDSGYVQPLDYFGDGTRIPLIAVSKYSTGGNISHTYTDHVSVLKFIEANWNVPPISNRSRDNLPNPVAGANPYKPANTPAIGNLMDLFNFGT
jgi:phospholipase C